MTERHRPWIAFLCALSLSFIGPHVRADDNAAAADQLYKEARTLAQKGSYAEACPKFQASYELERALGTLLNLADCHEHIGKTASAWAEWNEAIDLAKRNKDDRRVKFATKRRNEIEPKLARLKVEVTNPVASLSVYRNQSQLADATYNTALPIDPGEHEISVRRGDQVLKREAVTTKQGETATVSFDLKAIDEATPAVETPLPPPTTTAPPPSATTAPPPPTAAPSSSSQKTIGFVVGGAGVLALLVAGGLEVAALSKKSKADEPDQCVNNYCSPNGFKTVDDAKNLATIGQWVGIGGVLLTAVGATLILTSPSSEAPKTGRAQRPRLHAGGWMAKTGGGVSFGGAL
jgi:hypothetical protein